MSRLPIPVLRWIARHTQVTDMVWHVATKRRSCLVSLGAASYWRLITATK